MTELLFWIRHHPPARLRCRSRGRFDRFPFDPLCVRWRWHGGKHHEHHRYTAEGRPVITRWRRASWAERFAFGDHPVPR